MNGLIMGAKNKDKQGSKVGLAIKSDNSKIIKKYQVMRRRKNRIRHLCRNWLASYSSDAPGQNAD